MAKLNEKRVRSLDKMREMIRKNNNKTDFDLSYIKNIEFYKELGKRSMKVLEDSAYMEICKKLRKRKAFVIMIILIII